MTGVSRPAVDEVVGLFLTLARTLSPSRRERAVADVVRSYLESLGLAVSEDDAGAAIGGDAGNLRCLVPGTGTAPTLTFAAHLDTVEPSAGIEPVVDGGVVRNAAGTILGADNKAAVAAILAVTRELVEGEVEFPTYEVIFTVAEEQSVLGSRHLGEGLPSSPAAVVFDSTGPVGGIVTQAPTQQTIRADFKGRAAHAGLEPEKGRSAIQAAAHAVSMMSLGRLDECTTANVGTIEGGVAQNIVPAACRLTAECRSLDEERVAEVSAAMVEALHLGAAKAEVDVDIDLVTEYRTFKLSEKEPVVLRAKRALEELGIEPHFHISGGGSDANLFNARGVPTVNLDCGMMSVHTPDEHISTAELETLTRLVRAMIVPGASQGPKGGRDER